MGKVYDFSGWATRSNLVCSDGLVILDNAFEHNDGITVPLVWNHQHQDPTNILGHARLENRKDGVYTYCSFNDTDSGKRGRQLVEHGDVSSLSILATRLKQVGNKVVKGDIKEVSLVLAGANPGAYIDNIIAHGDDLYDEYGGEAIICPMEDIVLTHSEKIEDKEDEDEKTEDNKVTEDSTVGEIFNTFTPVQKEAVYYILGTAFEGKFDDEEEEDEDKEMKHNVFDSEKNADNIISHSEFKSIIDDAPRYGSLRKSFEQNGFGGDKLQHAVQNSKGENVTYGIADIEYLFPDARLAEGPSFISRDMDWVSSFMNSSKHLPFSRVKSIHANITMDEARAKGYIKGKEKENEVFTLLKRTTDPTTIYKKQKLDRDDILDITDMDVVSWLKSEMRVMLNEEIARAALIGDGRLSGSDDKISEDRIRPIWKDADLYTIKHEVKYEPTFTDNDKAKAFIKGIIKSRKEYRGSGNPVLFTTEDMLTDCLLVEDTTGRVIYDTMEKLRNTLRVSDIVTVPVMENQKRSNSGKNYLLLGIIVNPKDYAFGADKGGSVNMFDDFDIDFNQEKYLIETRCSGALLRPYSAIAIETEASSG